MLTRSREKLLHILEAVSPGISPKGIIEQSSCFVFNEGRVLTYNGEIACQAKTDMTIVGAVSAAPLLEALRKLPDDELGFETTEGKLVIHGKKKRTRVTMENEVLLPFDLVEPPKDWVNVPEDFSDAIGTVQHCAGTDASKFWATCLYVGPKWIEACDNDQICRFKIKTKVKEPILIRASSIAHIVPLGVKKFCETESWIHFQAQNELVVSCLRHLDSALDEDAKYPDLSGFFECPNSHGITIPKGLAEAVDRAEIFSKEDKDHNNVLVELWPGKLRVTGAGISGDHRESRKLKYNGAAISFRIAPQLLIELTKRYEKAEISSERLRVSGAKFQYVTCLGPVDEKEPDNGELVEETTTEGEE